MSKINNFYEKLLNKEIILKSIKKTASGRKNKPIVRKAFRDLDSFTEKILERMKNRNFKMGELITREIFEGSSKKRRTITYLKEFEPQCILAVLFDNIGHKLTNKSYFHSYGSMPGKGAHSLSNFIFDWIRKDVKHTKYYVKMDIRHCFQTIRHDMVRKACEHFVKDKDILKLLFSALDAYNKDIGIGLPIGFLTSPWFSHMVLSKIDFLASQSGNSSYYVRYMDDYIMFGSNKRHLLKNAIMIQEELRKMGMELHEDPIVKKLDEEPLEYIGFKFTRNEKTLRDDLKCRVLSGIESFKKNRNARNAKKLISYNGWMRSTSRSDDFKIDGLKNDLGEARRKAKNEQRKINEDKKAIENLSEEMRNKIAEEKRRQEEMEIAFSYMKEIEEYEKYMKEKWNF